MARFSRTLVYDLGDITDQELWDLIQACHWFANDSPGEPEMQARLTKLRNEMIHARDGKV